MADQAQILYAFGMPGGSELLIILFIVILVFGSSKLPQLGDALGKGIQNFRKSFQKDDTTAEAEVIEADVVTSPIEDSSKSAQKLEQD